MFLKDKHYDILRKLQDGWKINVKLSAGGGRFPSLTDGKQIDLKFNFGAYHYLLKSGLIEKDSTTRDGSLVVSVFVISKLGVKTLKRKDEPEPTVVVKVAPKPAEKPVAPSHGAALKDEAAGMESFVARSSDGYVVTLLIKEVSSFLKLKALLGLGEATAAQPLKNLLISVPNTEEDKGGARFTMEERKCDYCGKSYSKALTGRKPSIAKNCCGAGGCYALYQIDRAEAKAKNV